MKLSMERRVVRVLGCWQIIDGVITILFYGLFKRHQLSQLPDMTYQSAKAMDSLFGSAFIFISLFGTVLIGLGLFNLVLAKRYLKAQEISGKWLVWLIVVSLFSLLVMDIMGVILAVISIVLLVAKRQAIKKIRTNEYSRSQ